MCSLPATPWYDPTRGTSSRQRVVAALEERGQRGDDDVAPSLGRPSAVDCALDGPETGWSRMTLLDHVVVPVASEADATATCDALAPYLAEVQRVTAVHVVEKAGGAIDKAPLEKRREDAAEYLAVVDATIGDAVAVDTRTDFGTDVVPTLFDAAADANATAVAFRPRGGSRIVKLLAGDTATRLVTDPPIPVLALPGPEEE